ncbi:MAG: carbamoyl-phosphate synthase large subunit [Pseudomonadota bacterium]|nr:carbamoyl-phosphate synthase large subunit [Pseudomonadota bacterium]
MTPPPLTEWPGAEIVSGVAFQGDGAISIDTGTSGLPVLSFWRPILFREDSDRPVSGRMDCKVLASEGAFSDAAFDPQALHEDTKEARARQGLIDEDVLRDLGDNVRQIDIVGRRNAPHQHYVLSYIMVRDGDRLIDIRRNCTFVHGSGVSRIDALPYVYRYTKLSFSFKPGLGGSEGKAL